MQWYKFNIKDLTEEEYNKFYALLNPVKRERIERFKNLDDKKRSICAEMLAKRGIAQRYGIKLEDILIETSENGKPYCKNADIHFNLSHSGDYAVCAFGKNPVGIDIQKIAPYNERTAKKVCSEEEYEAIEKSKDKASEFIKLWTRKEAVAKMQGLGISGCSLKTCAENKNIKTFSFSDYFVSICEKDE